MSRRRRITVQRMARCVVFAGLWFGLSSFAPPGQAGAESAVVLSALLLSGAQTILFTPLPGAALVLALAAAPVVLWLVRHALYRTRRAARWLR